MLVTETARERAENDTPILVPVHDLALPQGRVCRLYVGNQTGASDGAALLAEDAAGIYKRGTYGNTMTGNPRALDVACAVLAQITPELRQNIRSQGEQALRKLEALKAELGGLITRVQGTGLLFSCELAPQFKCFGAGSTEEWLRERGIGVIHGGVNSLRFTPNFTIASDELELLVSMVGRALREGPQARQAAAA